MAEDRNRSPEITPEMLRAGVEAYLAWDEEAEGDEAMVAAVFWAMLRAQASLSPE
jgi:hypothetical protein